MWWRPWRKYADIHFLYISPLPAFTDPYCLIFATLLNVLCGVFTYTLITYIHSCNRAAQHELERDAGDKFSALNLDSTCHNMRNSSRGIAYHDGINRVDNTWVSNWMFCDFDTEKIPPIVDRIQKMITLYMWTLMWVAVNFKTVLADD